MNNSNLVKYLDLAKQKVINGNLGLTSKEVKQIFLDVIGKDVDEYSSTNERGIKTIHWLLPEEDNTRSGVWIWEIDPDINKYPGNAVYCDQKEIEYIFALFQVELEKRPVKQTDIFAVNQYA